MTARELLDYAEKNGFTTVKFSVRRDSTHICAAKFLDAYFEFIKIPVFEEGFVTISELENQLGDNLDFKILDESEYKDYIRLDFMLRGKKVPQKFMEIEENEKN